MEWLLGVFRSFSVLKVGRHGAGVGEEEDTIYGWHWVEI